MKLLRLNLSESVVACFLFAAIATGFYAAWTQGDLSDPEHLAFVFPAACALLMALAAGGLVFSKQDAAADEAARRWRPALWGFGALVIYIGVVGLIGFVLATFILQVVQFRTMLAKRGLIWLVVAPIVMTAVFSFVFAHLLSIPLPRGVGPFYDFTALLV